MWLYITESLMCRFWVTFIFQVTKAAVLFSWKVSDLSSVVLGGSEAPVRGNVDSLLETQLFVSGCKRQATGRRGSLQYWPEHVVYVSGWKYILKFLLKTEFFSVFLTNVVFSIKHRAKRFPLEIISVSLLMKVHISFHC